MKTLVAGVAQLVEQRIRNAKVGGSIPLTGTMIFFKINDLQDLNHLKTTKFAKARSFPGFFVRCSFVPSPCGVRLI